LAEKKSSVPLKRQRTDHARGEKAGLKPGLYRVRTAESQAMARVASDARALSFAAGVECMEVRPLAGGWRWI
jgi:hypothetical protein